MVIRSFHFPPQASILLTSPNPFENPNSHQKTLINSSVNLKSGIITTTALPPPAITDRGLLFREKLLYLKSLNVDPKKALERNPNFRSASLQTIKSVENCLSSMGIERAAFGRIFGMCPEILTRDPYKDLYPVFDFLLDDVGLQFSHIRTAILRNPRLLVSSIEDQLKPALCFLRVLGFVGRDRITCQTTVLLTCNVKSTMMRKLDFLMGLGFRYDEVANMVVRSPGLLTFSIEKNFKPKLEYFLKEMNGDLRDLKRFPQYFNFSLNDKIMPRHRLLVDQGLSMPLREMLEVSNGEFNARLIGMKLQILDNR